MSKQIKNGLKGATAPKSNKNSELKLNNVNKSLLTNIVNSEVFNATKKVAWYRETINNPNYHNKSSKVMLLNDKNDLKVLNTFKLLNKVNSLTNSELTTVLTVVNKLNNELHGRYLYLHHVNKHINQVYKLLNHKGSIVPNDVNVAIKKVNDVIINLNKFNEVKIDDL